jgi:hypothetical protein
MAVKLAFDIVVNAYPCYDYPPDTWKKDERDLWDALQELEIHARRNLEKIIKT